MFELDDLYVADLFIHDDNYNNDMINVGFYEKDKTFINNAPSNTPDIIAR